MKRLGRIAPTPEQLAIISTNQTGAELIRGAAGSGKTTTALMRLTSLTNMMRARKDRVGDDSPVSVLLLTFNRTLAGYVRALAEDQVRGADHKIEINTFAKWASSRLGDPTVHSDVHSWQSTSSCPLSPYIILQVFRFKPTKEVFHFVYGI